MVASFVLNTVYLCTTTGVHGFRTSHVASGTTSAWHSVQLEIKLGYQASTFIHNTLLMIVSVFFNFDFHHKDTLPDPPKMCADHVHDFQALLQ
mgnify:CR=1 FL=1